MLIHEGDSRTPRTDLVLASTLAFVAGGVNSAGFMAFHYFSANMTGNVSMASELLAIQRYDQAVTFLAIVMMFILGAFAASILIEFGRRRRHRNIYALTLSAESAILLGIGCSTVLEVGTSNGILIVGLLSFTMGIQNAASTRISGSRVRTTHVSGVATDIGVGLAMLIGSDVAEKAAVFRRLWLHFSTMAAFAIGGVIGVIGYQSLESAVFALFAAPLTTLAVRHFR